MPSPSNLVSRWSPDTPSPPGHLRQMLSRLRLRIKKPKTGKKRASASDRSSGNASNCPSSGPSGGHSSLQQEEDDVFATAHSHARTALPPASNMGDHDPSSRNEAPLAPPHLSRRLPVGHSYRQPSPSPSFPWPGPSAHEQPPAPTTQSPWPDQLASGRPSSEKYNELALQQDASWQEQFSFPDCQQSPFGQFAGNQSATHQTPSRYGPPRHVGQSPQRDMSTFGSGHFSHRTDQFAQQQGQPGREHHPNLTVQSSRRELPVSPQVSPWNNPSALQQGPLDQGQSSSIAHSPTEPVPYEDQLPADRSLGCGKPPFLSAGSLRRQSPTAYGQPSPSTALSWRERPRVYGRQHHPTAHHRRSRGH